VKQQIMDRYLGPVVRRASLSLHQETVVEFAFDLALTDMENACMATSAIEANAGAKAMADVHALDARIQEQDGELLRLTTIEDRLTQWLSSRGVMLNQFDNDLVAAVIGTSGNEALLSKLHEAQNSVAYLTDERNRLKRQMADLENTIEAVRDADQVRLSGTIAGVNGTLTIQNSDVVAHPNGHNGSTVAVAKPMRIDYAGTNEQLREDVFNAMRLFHKANGRAPSHNDWKSIGPSAKLPSANTIENRLGMRWTAIATAAGLEPNAKFNARSEGKADNAEATFPLRTN